MYKRAIINLDNIPSSVLSEINSFSSINYKNIKEILKDFRSYPIKKFDPINETLTLEYLILKKLLKQKWIKNIQFFSNKPMFIYNDSFYVIDDSKIKRINLSGLLFISLRWSNWNYPIFHILWELLKIKWWKLAKPNMNNFCIPFKWKIYALKSLYKKRKQLIWDIIIPYKILPNNYDLFISFIKEKFWNKVILKKDNTQVWEWVYPIDLENKTSIKKFKEVMKTHREYLKEVYIVPYYDFFQEYRFYFIKTNKGIKIYSFKIKEVDIINKNRFFEKASFKYWEDVNLNWKYIPNNQWKSKNWRYYKIYLKALEYIKYLDYQTWSLEFWLTKDWKFIFFEVNWMSDPICISEEDLNNMSSYYSDLLDYII
jgi:hypothetical protein